MIHPEEGRLRALADDQLAANEAGELRAHLAACAACDRTLRQLQETQLLTTALLDATDLLAPTERVRARLRQRAQGALVAAGVRSRRARWPVGRSELARAALLLLGFAGAVAAAVHPASPVRRWLSGERPGVTVAPALEVPAPIAPREVGVRVAVGDAGVRIALVEIPAGASIGVTWVDEGPAAVYAPEGATFSTSEAQGRINAVVAAGPVRIELPRSASPVTLLVNGGRYLEKIGERIDYFGPPALVEGPTVRFQVP